MRHPCSTIPKCQSWRQKTCQSVPFCAGPCVGVRSARARRFAAQKTLSYFALTRTTRNASGYLPRAVLQSHSPTLERIDEGGRIESSRTLFWFRSAITQDTTELSERTHEPCENARTNPTAMRYLRERTHEPCENRANEPNGLKKIARTNPTGYTKIERTNPTGRAKIERTNPTGHAKIERTNPTARMAARAALRIIKGSLCACQPLGQVNDDR